MTESKLPETSQSFDGETDPHMPDASPTELSLDELRAVAGGPVIVEM